MRVKVRVRVGVKREERREGGESEKIKMRVKDTRLEQEHLQYGP